MIYSDSTIRWLGTIFFFLAVFHTFFVNYITNYALQFNKKSILGRVYTFLGEVEIVFAFWAFIFLICFSYKFGIDASVQFLHHTNFSKAVFIFAMMCMSYTKPIFDFANLIILSFAKIIAKISFLPPKIVLFCSIYIFGTLSGSLITEPAAMTVCALLLYEHFFKYSQNLHFKYAMIALLFVNISIGGTLTVFAAPPILMVAQPWKLTNISLFFLLGWKTILAVFTSTILCALVFNKDIRASQSQTFFIKHKSPIPVIIINIIFLVFAVMYYQYSAFLIPLFIFFLGFYGVTKKFQNSLRLRESLLVGIFLGGIIVLGELQSWWVSPLVKASGFLSVFLSTVVLSPIIDNAAITYIASQIKNLPDVIKYAFLSGGVAGGGLTIIANAPNPIGYGILKQAFGKNGIKPLWLFIWALPPTIIALSYFYFLRK